MDRIRCAEYTNTRIGDYMKKCLLLFTLFLGSFCFSVDAKSLYDKLNETAVLDSINSEFVSKETGIDFSEVSSDTNGKGLYKMTSSTNNRFPILYYRGDIDNNYVIYAGYCWNIIRTTETGGIKIMYAGVPEQNTCHNEKEALAIGKSQYNDSNVSPKFGWTYEENGQEKDSVAKSYLDNWYQEHMTDYTRELEDTFWCNDRRMDDSSVFDARTRLENGNPTLSCDEGDRYTVSSNKGNGKLVYPTGIINADELTFAGEVLKKTQVDTFVNIGYSYWSMTPYVLTKNMYPNSKGMLNMYTFTYNAGIRPMISLRNTATFNTGDGTEDNPYRVEVEKQYKIYNDDYSSTQMDESEAGENVLISIQERDGYQFVGMKVLDLDGNDLGISITKVGDQYQFVMPQKDVQVQTNYRIVKDSFPLTSDQEEVIISEEMVEEDQEASFQIHPQHGYQLESLTFLDENGDSLDISFSQNGDTYKFTMPGQAIKILATFIELPKYSVIGEDILLEQEEFYEGDTVTFQVKKYPNKDVLGIHFYNEEEEEVLLDYHNQDGVYSFSMVDENLTIKVQYIEQIYQNPKTMAMEEVVDYFNVSLTLVLLIVASSATYVRKEITK